MKIEELKKAQYEADDREQLERFPHFTLYGDEDGNHRIELSSGQRLELGKVHKAAVMDIVELVKTINKLAQDPTVLSYEALKDRYGEYKN